MAFSSFNSRIAAPVTYSGVAGRSVVGSGFTSGIVGTTTGFPVTYSTSALPAATTIAAPAPITYAAPVSSVVETIAAPAPVPVIAERNLLAMGNVISEREITIEELAAMDRYTAAEAIDIGIVTEAPAPVIVEAAPIVTTAAPVMAAPMITTMAAPMTYAAPMMTTMAAPVTYASTGFTSAPVTYASAGLPYTTMAAPVAYETVETVAAEEPVIF